MTLPVFDGVRRRVGCRSSGRSSPTLTGNYMIPSRIIIPKSLRNLCQIGVLKGRLDGFQQRTIRAWTDCALLDNDGGHIAAQRAMPTRNPKTPVRSHCCCKTHKKALRARLCRPECSVTQHALSETHSGRMSTAKCLPVDLREAGVADVPGDIWSCHARRYAFAAVGVTGRKPTLDDLRRQHVRRARGFRFRHLWLLRAAHRTRVFSAR